ncbi:MAG: hypothetical protein IJH12_02520 [Clostridia bacterium]|nr:hypothetical protein [Clostridia bacterium]
MEGKEIAERIRKLQKEIKEQELSGATAKQLAKYLIEVDKLTALMIATHRNNSEEQEEQR